MSRLVISVRIVVNPPGRRLSLNDFAGGSEQLERELKVVFLEQQKKRGIEPVGGVDAVHHHFLHDLRASKVPGRYRVLIRKEAAPLFTSKTKLPTSVSKEARTQSSARADTLSEGTVSSITA
jgi:hypothetical protein